MKNEDDVSFKETMVVSLTTQRVAQNTTRNEDDASFQKINNGCTIDTKIT